MLLFFAAVAVALLGVGVYDLYNPGTRDVAMAGHQFMAVPNWAPVAAGAAVPLSLFLLYALWTSVRIRLLKRAVRRAADWAGDGDWEMVPPRPPWLLAEERLPVEPEPPQQPHQPERGARRRRASQTAPPPVSPQPAPKRSWLPPD